jgi:hypothetical protein
VLTVALFAQLAVATHAVTPVLGFPDAGLDDTSAYRGYQTRFFRDAAQNTLQVYVDQRSARVVHLLADADNASVGFTVRTPAGSIPDVRWGATSALVGQRGHTRQFTHSLTASGAAINLGWFLLGSMRVERDFQYEQRARGGFASAPYAIPDVDRLIAALDKLPTPVRSRHLALLNARTTDQVRARMYPHPTLTRTTSHWRARVVQVTLDGNDTLTLELSGRTQDVRAIVAGDSLMLRASRGDSVTFTTQITTTARPLTPLTREQIFTPDFLAFLAETNARGSRTSASDTAAIRARRMERQVRGVELLVSREKLMAGLPTYATYFGRDMLMTALMMRPIWRHEALEAVIATALRKLGPRGDVSHEEALGDQAVRESAGEYASLVERALADTANAGDAALLARADTVLRRLRVTRENYHMIDDEYQLPIVVARWITDAAVTPAAKRAFLLARDATGVTRAQQLVRELALVARLAAPYAANPVTTNLIAFAPRAPAGFETASWRDSGAGYAGGRYAMDINTIWVPHALDALGRILTALQDLGIHVGDVTSGDTPLAQFAKSPAALQHAIATWKGAEQHFVVQRDAAAVRAAVTARLAAMPDGERAWWLSRPGTDAALRDSIAFLAVALDGAGAPIPVANTDAATRIFLGEGDGPSTPPSDAATARLQRDAALFTRPYPVGLLVDRIGPVVANDAYATPAVWDAFVKDPYHGPRVVWGREVNLFLLGMANQLSRDSDTGVKAAERRSVMRTALNTVRSAVEESGFHTELWSYGFERGTLGAMRYGSGADIQLWSTTDLAVQYVLARLPAAR